MKKLVQLKIIAIFLLIGFMIPFSIGSPGQKGKKSKKQDPVFEQKKQASGIAMLIDAKKYEITGNPDKAEELYRQCIDKFPEDATANFELARLLADKKQYSDAGNYAQKAVILNPDNLWYQLFLAEVSQLNGKLKETIAIYEKISEKNPENLDYLYQLAALYLAIEKYSDAINVYNKIEIKIGITEEISVQKEKIYLQLNNNSKAREELEALIKAYPDESKYLSVLAEFYMANKMPDKALELYQKIALIDPKNPYIHMSMADYYRKTGDNAKAFEELKLGFANPDLNIDAKINILLSFYTLNQMYNELKVQAFTLAKILVATHPDEAKSHSVYADLLLQDKKTAEARDEFLVVVKLDSSRYVIWEEVLQLDLQLSKFDHLSITGKTVMELFPEQPIPYILAGIADYQLKEYEKALKVLNTGAKLVINNDELLSQFYMYLGDNYHALKKTEESDKAYEKSLALQDSNAYVLNNYSYYLSVRNENLDKAETMAKRAVTLEPENASFQDTYGWVLFRLGKYEEAKTWVYKSIQSKEVPSGEVLEHYGDILFKLGDSVQALDYWQKAKAKGQASEFIDKKIADKKLYE